VNRKRLSDGEGPDLLMKWVHKYNTISISVRKPPPPSLLPSPSEHGTSSSPTITPKTSTKTTKNKKKSVATTKKDKSTTTTTTDESNKNKIVTITAEKPESSSTNKSNKGNNCGLVFEIQNKKIFVVDILPNSMFFESSSTPPEQQHQLNIGDCILTINDMCFRKYADIDYAYQIMNKSKIMVILVVEKQKGVVAPQQQNKKIKKKSSSFSIKKKSSSNKISKLYDDDDDNDNDTSTTSSTSSNSTDNDDNDEFCSSISSHNKNDRTITKKKKKKKTTVIKPKRALTNSSKYEFEIESEFKIEKYRPITITVPKHFSSGHTESIGVEFQIIKTNKGDALNTVIEHDNDTAALPPKTTSWIYVSKIDNDSLFENTPLKVGDKIISINDINLRNNDHNKMIDTGIRQAYKACLKAKEFITMTILKDDETIFLEKSFTFDNSSTNLDWRF
jgi:hypothetical protein